MNYLEVDRDRAAERYRAALMTDSPAAPALLMQVGQTQKRLREYRAALKNYGAAEIRSQAFASEDPATVSKLFAQAQALNDEADVLSSITLDDSALMLGIIFTATPEAIGEHALQVMLRASTGRAPQ
jgi:lipopolysaccharide biosynthesis regulator YciM